VVDVIIIPAFSDNFIYLHPCGRGRAFAVDPGDASAVLDALGRHRLSLAAILATHHHRDHVGGIAELKSRTGCAVIGPADPRIPSLDRAIADGDVLPLGRASVEAMATAGHTSMSFCYRVADGQSNSQVVYTGDTLFVGGCGRVLESDARTMWRSLQRLAGLPGGTLVCCGHDYTLENYEFALTILPGDETIRRRLAEVKETVAAGRLPVPSTIAQEKAANVFLRCADPPVRTALGREDAEAWELFAELRRRKDRF